MFNSLIRNRPQPIADFDEAAYLAAHPDVAAAVRRGDEVSGLDHYRRCGQKEGRALRASSALALDNYVSEPPSQAAAFDLFKGEWASDIPNFGQGHALLFDDERIKWLAQCCGGFAGKTVLELGPLEAGHTHMLEQRGAQVTAIESNRRAFLKCLIVKNALGLQSDFVLGDFRPYLASTDDRFDLLLASGVLYHMTDPIGLIDGMARVSDHIGIWTHYYDETLAATPELRAKFAVEAEERTVNGVQVRLHKQVYLEAAAVNCFCGGSSHHSYWLEKGSLFDYWRALGFNVDAQRESPNPNGPAVLFYATRN